MTRFVWLRQFEPGGNSADANRLLDRLEHLRRLDVPEGLFREIPPHRITRLRRHGERYFAGGLRELPDNRRLAILAVCAVEWELFLVDAVVETNDRVVGRTYREAARACEAQLGDESAAVRESLRAFAELGTALIGARDTGEALDAVITDGPGWEGLGDLVAKAAALTNTVVSDPLNHVLGGYSRFRRYTPRMLRTLDIEASLAAEPLLKAVAVLRSDGTARPTGFLRPNRGGAGCCAPNPITVSGRRRCCSTCGTRSAPATSGWRGRAATATSERRCCRFPPALMPTAACRLRPVRTTGSPSAGSPSTRASAGWPPRRGPRRSPAGASKTACSASRGRKPPCRTGPLTWSPTSTGGCPRRASRTSCSRWTTPPRFTEAFTHLRTGEPCRDRIGLLNVLLAEGINLGLRKMAEATTTHGFWELMRIARWHVEGGGKVNVDLIDRNWADILRVASTMAAGTMRPSQLLRKLAAYPRQTELAAALREVGRIERSLFMIEWTTDPDVRRRALVGLNKGEAHHALKRAINFHRRGELRDRTGEGQHYRVAGLNLLAAIIIYWNTLKLGDAVFASTST